MKLFNWNTEFVSPNARAGKFQKLREIILSQNPEIVCLTEAYPEAMPKGGQTIKSEISGPGTRRNKAARGRSSFGVERAGEMWITLGSPNLPEGRFASATTTIDGLEWTIVGMCIPYHGYHNHKKWGDGRKRNWQGACEFLDALRGEILTAAASSRIANDSCSVISTCRYRRKTIPIGIRR